MVKKVLPVCGHKVEMHCSQDPATFSCEKKCKRTMQCGHSCRRICSESCGCAKLIKKIIPVCGHEVSPGHRIYHCVFIYMHIIMVKSYYGSINSFM
jgi:hypothetical protein